MKHLKTSCISASTLILVLALTAQAQPARSSLYADLGGDTGISNIIDESVLIFLQDARIRASFKETNMQRLAILLKEQFCVISDGPCKYTGDDMKTVHQGMGINAAQFYALAEDVQIAMDKLGIASSVQNRLMARLAPMKRDIVLPKTVSH